MVAATQTGRLCMKIKKHLSFTGLRKRLSEAFNKLADILDFGQTSKKAFEINRLLVFFSSV